MSTTDPLHVLFEVVGTQEHRDAFIFLSYKQGDTWSDMAYHYYKDELFNSTLPDPSGGDVYFCPNTFSKAKRRQEYFLPSQWLYADLDEVHPDRADELGIPRATLAWETSPGRYQALWRIAEPLGPEAHMKLNKKLTYAMGADKGGWGLTKVLRLPGTINHKPEYDSPEVTLLWGDSWYRYTDDENPTYAKDYE